MLDNERYGETGMQLTHTGQGVDIAGIALASGFARASIVRTNTELESNVAALYDASGPVLVVAKIGTDAAPPSLPPRDGPYLRSRFREALLGAAAHA